VFCRRKVLNDMRVRVNCPSTLCWVVNPTSVYFLSCFDIFHSLMQDVQMSKMYMNAFRYVSLTQRSQKLDMLFSCLLDFTPCVSFSRNRRWMKKRSN